MTQKSSVSPERLKALIGDFIREDVGGIMVTDSELNILYSNLGDKLPESAAENIIKRSAGLRIGTKGKSWEFTDSKELWADLEFFL